MKLAAKWALLLAGLVVVGFSPDILSTPRTQQRPITLVDLQASHPPSEGTFSNIDIRGHYGFSFDGQVVDGPLTGPVAAIGWIDNDGAGNATATRTLVLNGIVFRQTSVGTYRVRADGTGSATFTITTVSPPGIPDAVERFDFVITNDRRDIEFVATSPGVVARGVSRRLVN